MAFLYIALLTNPFLLSIITVYSALIMHRCNNPEKEMQS